MTDWNASSDEEFRAEARRFFENEFPAEFKFLPRRMRWSECRDWYLKLSKKAGSRPTGRLNTAVWACRRRNC